MVSIIAVHCSGGLDVVGGTHWQLTLAVKSPFKFGTIGFFIIAGFLLGERVDRRDPLEYLNRRFKRVFLPWCFWFAMVCIPLVLDQLVSNGLARQPATEILRVAASISLRYGLSSAFWFVPNLLLCIAILLTFRRYLYSLKLGAVLLAANLVYVANIYGLWFTSEHPAAMFGFVFYLWLGSYAAHRFEALCAVLEKIPGSVFFGLSFFWLAVSCAEGYWLTLLHNPAPDNTLRASCQIFSIFMVLWFFKMSRATWPSWVDVRRNTFGLYLSHSVVLMILSRVVFRLTFTAKGSAWLADLEAVGIWALLSTVTYMTCLGISIMLGRQPSLQWMVGLGPKDANPAVATDKTDKPDPRSYVQTQE